MNLKLYTIIKYYQFENSQYCFIKLYVLDLLGAKNNPICLKIVGIKNIKIIN